MRFAANTRKNPSPQPAASLYHPQRLHRSRMQAFCVSAEYHQVTMSVSQKPPIYLLDSMAFIFRAYHAMQRQRPMSTRTGIPTAATYVFVNMINKLRKDFAPQYLAAVYDVGAPVHRNELAAQMKDVQKFNIKTQAVRDHRVRRLQGQPRRDPARPHPAAALHPPRARSLPHPHPLLRGLRGRRRHRHALLQALRARPPRLRRLAPTRT